MILSCRDLSKSFGGNKAVDGVNLVIERSEISSIIGPNGAGKTTLFNLLTGYLPADSGQVWFEDRQITRFSPHQISQLGVVRTFQGSNLFPRMTVFENVQVALFARLKQTGSFSSRAKDLLRPEVEEILTSVSLENSSDMPAGFLSGGNKKRLELAIALAAGSQVLLLDEPTAGVEPKDTSSMTRLIETLTREKGMTVMFIEHDMDVVFAISEKVRVMHQGRSWQKALPMKAQESGSVGSLSGLGHMSLLELQEIETFYDKTQVIFGLSLQVEPGEAVCLLGRNGAAKSTTLKSIMGLTPPRAGRILYQGQDIAGEPPHRIARRGIGYAPQDRIIFPDLTVRQNLELPQAGPSNGRLEWTVEKVYALFPQLRELESNPGFALSGGEQRMLAIGRALMLNPVILLLDEPGEGLSPAAVSRLRKALQEIRREGVSLLFAEHNLRFALDLSNRIYFIERGATRYHGTSAEVSGDPQILYTHLGVQPTRSASGS